MKSRSAASFAPGAGSPSNSRARSAATSRAFQLAVALTLVGAAFGAIALRIDPEAKAVIMPFEALR